MISKQFKQVSHDVSMKNPCPKTTTLQQQSLSPEVEANKITLLKKNKKNKKWWNFPVGLCCGDCEQPRKVTTVSDPAPASIP